MSAKPKTDTDMPFFEVVEKRVSVRKYKANPVKPEHLELILEAARQAPNAGNQQPWRFLVVQDKAILKKFRDKAWRARKKWLLDNGYEADSDDEMKAHYNNILGAPLHVVILVDTAVKHKGYADKDGALAAENLMLAARALGYGSVMITGSVSANTLREFFEIPRRYVINCLIPIGVPDSWPSKRDRRPLSEFVFKEKVPKRAPRATNT